MNKESILNLASKFLREMNINFIEPGEFGKTEGCKQEVIFLDPDVLDPNVTIVIPGDIRVWVDIESKKVSLIYQM